MDVIYLSEKSIRIKGKNCAVIINPAVGIGKTEAEAVVRLSDFSEFNESKIEGVRITIKGAGEYEVNGAKVSAIPVDGRLVARIEIDGVSLMVGDGSLLEKIHEKVEGSNVALVEAVSEFNYSMLSTLEPNILIVYGPKKNDVAKSLGKELSTVSKFSTTSDKLPQEMQFTLLG